jgi:hypothetical protein
MYNPRVFLRTWGNNVCNALGPLVCNASAGDSTVEFLFRPTVTMPLPATTANCETACSTDTLLPHTSAWLGADSYYFSTMCMGTSFNNGMNYSPACDLKGPAETTSCICSMDPASRRTITSADVSNQTAVNPSTLINDLLMSQK